MYLHHYLVHLVYSTFGIMPIYLHPLYDVHVHVYAHAYTHAYACTSESSRGIGIAHYVWGAVAANPLVKHI